MVFRMLNARQSGCGAVDKSFRSGVAGIHLSDLRVVLAYERVA